MTFKSRLTFAFCAGILTVAAGLVSAPIGAQAPTQSVNDGVYTAEQADRGQQTFEGSCAMCHDLDRFKGVSFMESWKNEPLFSLFLTMSTTMPADNPGGLKSQEYGDIIAYFLKLNGYPVGTSELVGSKDALGAIRLEPVKSH